MGIIKIFYYILIGKTLVKRNAIYYFYQNLFLLVVLTCWKRNTFQKKRKIIFKTLFSPSFDLLHTSPIVYMYHMELILQDLLLYCTKKVAESHNQFVHFRHGGETHIPVLAQTLIYSDLHSISKKVFKSSEVSRRVNFFERYFSSLLMTNYKF